MQFLGKLQKFSHITALPKPQDGDMVYCEERHEYYIYSKAKEKWVKREIKSSSPIEVSLYDLNKSFYASQEPLTDEAKKEKRKIITEYCSTTKNQYYMLMCKEISYYTVLHKDGENPEFCHLGCAVTELLDELNWEIYDIYMPNTKDAHCEIWVKKGDEYHCMMLFAYDFGVVTFGDE